MLFPYSEHILGEKLTKLNCFIISILFLASGCLSGDTADSEGENDGEIVLTIWYTFEGKEEDVFLGSIAKFEDSEENIKV